MYNSVLPKKSLGQHFLVNPAIAQAMVEKMRGDNLKVLEIGPGTGNLTVHLLACTRVVQVIAIEIDRNAIKYLEQRFVKEIQDGKLILLQADIKKLSIKELSTPRLTIVSNLPYNIGTSLLISLLEELESIDQIIIMLQKEVADRLTAKYNTKAYGKISILLQNMCHIKQIIRVGKNSFFPPPKVLSAVVDIHPKTERPSVTELKMITKLCNIGFNMRRKKLLKCLIKALNLSPQDVERILNILPAMIDTRIEAMQPAEILVLVKAINQYL